MDTSKPLAERTEASAVPQAPPPITAARMPDLRECRSSNIIPGVREHAPPRHQGALAADAGRLHHRLDLAPRGVVRRGTLREGAGGNLARAPPRRSGCAAHARNGAEPVVGVVREIAARRIRYPCRAHPC